MKKYEDFKDRNENDHLPAEESRHPEHPDAPADWLQEGRDYVSESTARGEGIYDESLFDREDSAIPPAQDRETALTKSDAGLPATESPEEAAARRESPPKDAKQVLPGNHDLTDEEFSQVAEHPHPTDETDVPGEPEELQTRDIDKYIESIGPDKNVTRLDKAIEDRAAEPEPEHPHMHESGDLKERIEMEKDKEMNEADRFNVFKQSRYRGDQ